MMTRMRRVFVRPVPYLRTVNRNNGTAPSTGGTAEMAMLRSTALSRTKRRTMVEGMGRQAGMVEVQIYRIEVLFGWVPTIQLTNNRSPTHTHIPY